MSERAEQVVIAEILRSRGNRGEVVARSLTDVPRRLEDLKSATIRLIDGRELPVTIERAWPHQDHWVLKFAGCDSIEAAERFRGADLCIPRSERGELLDGGYFRSDLIGCVVRDQVSGQDVGPVVGFQQYGGPLLLEVSARGREVLIPFVPDICRTVDLNSRLIDALLPEGLLEL